MISLRYLFSLIFFWIHLACAGGSPLLAVRPLDSGITPDLTEMLKNPNLPLSKSAHLATHVTQPFAQDSTQEMTFFSDPKKHYGDWNARFQTHTQQRTQKLSVFDVFSLMGISRRAILLDGNKAYTTLSDAQKIGMLGIVQGRLGFKNKYLNALEKEIVARELLYIGRSLTAAGLRENLKSFEGLYRGAGTDTRKRRHFQICALLMIAGYDRNQINHSEWYLNGVLDKGALLSKIYDYEDRLLPKLPTESAGAGTVTAVSTDFLKRLVTAAKGEEWGATIARLLADPLTTTAMNEPEQRAIIEAIIRLNKHEGKETEDYDAGEDWSVLNKAYRKLFPPVAAKVVPVEVHIQNYLNTSRILNVYTGSERENIKKVFASALLSYVRKNGNVWPGAATFKTNEQFFWNLQTFSLQSYLTEDFQRLLFATKIQGSWQDFLDFSEPYLRAADSNQKKYYLIMLFPIYQAFPSAEVRQTFLDFCEPYLSGRGAGSKILLLNDLFFIFQTFSDAPQRRAFMDFCKPYMQTNIKNGRYLLPVYQAFPDATRRKAFLDFCELCGIGTAYLQNVLSIYQAFPDISKRREFLAFCEPYLKETFGRNKSDILNDLFLVFQALPNVSQRKAFLDFCELYKEKPGTHSLRELLPVYQAFPEVTERINFIAFCNHFKSPSLPVKSSLMSTVLPIYQKLSTQPQRNDFLAFCKHVQSHGFIAEFFTIYQAFPTAAERQAFLEFCEPHIADKKIDFKLAYIDFLLPIYQGYLEDFKNFRQVIDTRSLNVIINYISRTYLRYMRVNAALHAEKNPTETRIQAMYETLVNNQLPILWAEDPRMQQARNIRRADANAHDFDAVYELDRALFFKQCEEVLGYETISSAIPHTLYHNAEKRYGYQTNLEVEDFIRYLDTTIAIGPDLTLDRKKITGAKVVSLVKQMLGLEQKTGGTSGSFAPYLGHSMYYANPDAPKGDEMLGRVWFYMKAIAKNPKDEELNKKSVVLAVLEAAELSSAGASTHCQTRMTGELMKLIAFNLPGSKLRPLIAAEDLPPVPTADAAAMDARITAASIRAQQLFNRLKREDSGAIRALIERHTIAGTDPELWERYEAYYDDLYRRTKNPDGTFKKDEHILMRDVRGNLVSLYDATGTLRAEPVIVYYQAEFQVFEQTFTELMRREFEEQRGLLY